MRIFCHRQTVRCEHGGGNCGLAEALSIMSACARALDRVEAPPPVPPEAGPYRPAISLRSGTGGMNIAGSTALAGCGRQQYLRGLYIRGLYISTKPFPSNCESAWFRSLQLRERVV